MALQVFLPSQCLMCPSGILIGYLDATTRRCCITGLFGFTDGYQPTNLRNCSSLPTTVFNGITDKKNLQDKQVSVVGIWNNHIYENIEIDSYSCSQASNGQHFLEIHQWDSQTPETRALGLWKSEQHIESTVLILYDAGLLGRSSFLMNKDSSSSSTKDAASPNTLLQFLSKYGMESKDIKPNEKSLLLENLEWNNFVQDKTTFVDILMNKTILLVASVMTLIACCFEKIFNNRLWQSCFSGNIISSPSTIRQIQTKFRSLTSLNNTPLKGTEALRYRNAFIRLILDTVLGVMVLYFVQQENVVAHAGEWIMLQAEIIASQLQRLLEWMMGVPAGLKLNSQLAHFLGKFFTYHIYLWTGYLRFLKPLWYDALWCVNWSGCFGLTIQISLLQDLLSMMTLHIYCFYVYAARLYDLQVSALSSLWRLFRGKKWNPLRFRMDSSSFDIDQLFIGALIFTILLFLLPTTALFYVVFAMLRLVVLALQGCLYKVLSVMNRYLVYTLYLWIFDAGKLAGDINVHLISSNMEKNIVMALEFSTAPGLTFFRRGTLLSENTITSSYSWGKLLSFLLRGKLIYPWIDVEN